MKTRKHHLLDHPIWGYFLLLIFTFTLSTIFTSLIDTPLISIIPGYGTEVTVLGITKTQAVGIGAAIGAFIALIIFKSWFRPEFKGVLSKNTILPGIIMLLPPAIIQYVGSIVSIMTFGSSGILVAFLRALAPGFSEEIGFRGLGIANYMRTIKSEKQIMTIFWISSVVFGVSHSLNVLAGGDLVSSIVQVLFALGAGMLWGAVYLRTANLWSVIIIHTSYDFFEFIRGDLNASMGAMAGLGIGDYIGCVGSIVSIILSLKLLNSKYHSEIMKVWADKWSKEV